MKRNDRGSQKHRILTLTNHKPFSLTWTGHRNTSLVATQQRAPAFIHVRTTDWCGEWVVPATSLNPGGPYWKWVATNFNTTWKITGNWINVYMDVVPFSILKNLAFDSKNGGKKTYSNMFILWFFYFFIFYVHGRGRGQGILVVSAAVLCSCCRSEPRLRQKEPPIPNKSLMRVSSLWRPVQELLKEKQQVLFKELDRSADTKIMYLNLNKSKHFKI